MLATATEVNTEQLLAFEKIFVTHKAEQLAEGPTLSRSEGLSAKMNEPLRNHPDCVAD